ncbi:maker153 [Drosophila busckii]|uniref:Maker153 n=1 Tax=Drosophila busckii TaxID=30019 RepID=A0A0M4EF55_DROBS|nr:uncharacterized protein LOC108595798 [Drosophila busckii]ALC42827.1 maker153 [Drosophila busckii]
MARLILILLCLTLLSSSLALPTILNVVGGVIVPAITHRVVLTAFKLGGLASSASGALTAATAATASAAASGASASRRATADPYAGYSARYRRQAEQATNLAADFVDNLNSWLNQAATMIAGNTLVTNLLSLRNRIRRALELETYAHAALTKRSVADNEHSMILVQPSKPVRRRAIEQDISKLKSKSDAIDYNRPARQSNELSPATSQPQGPPPADTTDILPPKTFEPSRVELNVPNMEVVSFVFKQLMVIVRQYASPQLIRHVFRTMLKVWSATNPPVQF